MAETTGLVQQLIVLSATATCAWIGPTADNASALVVTNDGSAEGLAFSESLVHALATAATNYRQVTASHADADATITSIRIDPV
jgi:hypothetical protein